MPFLLLKFTGSVLK